MYRLNRRRSVRRRITMKPLRTLVIAGLALMLGVTLSWGGPPNPTASDDEGNTAGGSGALINVFTSDPGEGEQNTAFGRDALNANTTGTFNTASGYAALASNLTGFANTACGGFALHDNTTGNSNTASGADALASNTTGFANTALGSFALVESTGNKNIAIGYNAGSLLHSGKKNIY